MAEKGYFEVLGSLTAQYDDLLDSKPYDAVLRRLEFSHADREGVMDLGRVYLDSGRLEADFVDADPDTIPGGELYKAYHPRRDLEMLSDIMEEEAPGWEFWGTLTSGNVNVSPERYSDRSFTGTLSAGEDVLTNPEFQEFFEDVFHVEPSELAGIEEI
jgi:hypothetical protein